MEVFWEAPANPEKKWPAIVYIHGVQDESGPGAINFVKGGLLSSTAKLGYFAVGMSMPGYGQSSGDRDFCGRGSQQALQAVLAYLRNRADVDANHIAVTGFSCGAVVAAMLADKEPLAAMILIAGVYDFEDMYAKWQTPAWPIPREVLRYIEKCVATDGGLKSAAQYRSALPNAKRFKMPVLLIAGEKDRTADSAQAKALFKEIESNGNANRLIVIPDGGHGLPYEEWAKHSTEFLRHFVDAK
jgi:dipeptidyl aminopeptidase/acylaminoacyl peptidase